MDAQGVWTCLCSACALRACGLLHSRSALVSILSLAVWHDLLVWCTCSVPAGARSPFITHFCLQFEQSLSSAAIGLVEKVNINQTSDFRQLAGMNSMNVIATDVTLINRLCCHWSSAAGTVAALSSYALDGICCSVGCVQSSLGSRKSGVLSVHHIDPNCSCLCCWGFGLWKGPQCLKQLQLLCPHSLAQSCNMLS
jgi:hypothetical protein